MGLHHGVTLRPQSTSASGATKSLDPQDPGRYIDQELDMDLKLTCIRNRVRQRAHHFARHDLPLRT